MTARFLAAAAALATVAHSAALSAALLPVLAAAVALEAIHVTHRLARRRVRHP